MVFFAASALLQPVAGFLVDRVGGQKVLLGGVGLMAVGMLIAGFAYSTPVLALGMFLMGVGNSVFHPADFSILNGRVTPARLGYAFSAHGVAGSLGFAFAPIFSAGIAALYGWHAALLAAAAVAAAIFAMLVLQRRHAARAPASTQETAARCAMRACSPRRRCCCASFSS